MTYKQFNVVVRDIGGVKHKFTYRAVNEDEVVEKVKRIMPGVTIKSVNPA